MRVSVRGVLILVRLATAEPTYSKRERRIGSPTPATGQATVQPNACGGPTRTSELWTPTRLRCAYLFGSCTNVELLGTKQGRDCTRTNTFLQNLWRPRRTD